MRPSFAVEESVRTLGANLKAARLRRRLPQSVVAERAGISLNPLSKLENGDCGIAIGNVASVLQALGLGTPSPTSPLRATMRRGSCSRHAASPAGPASRRRRYEQK